MRTSTSHKALTPAVGRWLLSTLIAWMSACGSPGDSAPPSLPALPPPVHEAAIPSRGPERPLRRLAIALVGEVRGEIEPCGCPTIPYGGFARREALLDELRTGDEPVFHFDAGELVLKGFATTRAPDRANRAALMLRLSAEVGVDAWVPGPSDLLVLGLDGLKRLKKGEAPPPVSASWLDPETHESVLPPAKVVERHGVRVGVIGLSAEPTGEWRKRLAYRSPVAAARAGLAALPGDLDLVVVVGNVADEAADAVAAQVDGIAALLTTRGVHADAPRQPRRADGSPGALIVEAPDRGRFVEIVRTRLGSTAGQPLVERPPAEDWRTLRELTRQAEAGRASPAAQKRLAEEEALFADLGRGRNLAWVESRPLGSDLDQDEGIAARSVAAFKARAARAAALRAAAPPPPAQPGYATASACVNCHLEQFTRWTYTDHAKAWLSIVERRQTKNPECVGCHSTGYGEPGGFGDQDPAAIRAFKAVQCEACHGPMRGHPSDERIKGQPVTAEVCRRCHDPANSPKFEFTSYLPRATCTPKTDRPGAAPAARGIELVKTPKPADDG